LAHGFNASESKAFDRCDVCHSTQFPLDVSYAARHVISRFGSARSTLEQAQVCAVCHSDPLIRAEHELPNAVASYLRSFHGRAALLGDESTADCLACHVPSGANAHLMLGPEDPLSSVHPGNVANSCRSLVCHPGADRGIAGTAVHLDLPSARGTLEYLLAAAFILLTVVSFGPSAVIVLLELAQLVVGRKHHDHHAIEGLVNRLMADPTGRRRLERFTRSARIQHWVLAILFTLLALTGFPLKFADQLWSRALVDFFGGMHSTRTIHHYAGLALIIGFTIHLLDVLRVMMRLRRQAAQAGKSGGMVQAFLSLPLSITPADLIKARELLAYLVGLRRERPRFGRFTATEKFEYFGVMWGTTLLGITGVMLWFEQMTSHLLGGWAFNFATIIHTYESFLALIHVGILHIYNVVLAPAVFPLSRATLTGETPPAKLAEENSEFVMEVAQSLGMQPKEPTRG
jgi:cytochrome b subunit of formate dehydrogenase